MTRPGVKRPGQRQREQWSINQVGDRSLGGAFHGRRRLSIDRTADRTQCGGAVA